MSTDDGEQVRPFAATLQEIGRGSVHDRLSEQLQQLVAAVTETGKKGTLTLQLTVAPVKPGNVHNLLVTAKTALKAPEGDEAAPSSVFFHDTAGNLSREDPTQLKLPLRGVETKKGASA
jgi:hypothetical protein